MSQLLLTQMTNNHLYWTVTTILQEQSGTRRAEIVKHMIKIASVLSCFLFIVHPIVTHYVTLLCMTNIYVGLLLSFLEYLRDLRNFNTMFAILRCVFVSVVSMCILLLMFYYTMCLYCCSLSGLNHSLVQRLKPTWEKVPGKYRKMKKVCKCSKLKCFEIRFGLILGLGIVHGPNKKFCEIS